MNFSEKQELKLKQEARIVLFSFGAILAGAVYLGCTSIFDILNSLETLRSKNNEILAQNHKQIVENKFFRDNQSQIESMWTTLKNYGNGIALTQMGALTQIGFTDSQVIPPSRAPSSNTEYNGIRISGAKAEYQRVVDALATIESQQGLLQVKSAIITLPPTANPNDTRPTFVHSQLELVAPYAR